MTNVKTPIGNGPANSVSRRRFLKTGGLAVAGTVISAADDDGHGQDSPQERQSLRTPSTKKIRVGIAGGGNFGNHFHQFTKHPNSEVVAVTDLRPKRRRRLMKTYECSNAYNSLEEMVKDPNIDAIAIFTDGNLHVRHVVEAMKHGKHALSAVPACFGTIEEAELLLDTVTTHGLTYMMAETSYFSDLTFSARDFHKRGEFGELYYFESCYNHPGVKSLSFEDGDDADDGPQWKKGTPTWRHGFAPMHYITHNAGYFISVTGERFVEVSCTGWGNDDPALVGNAYGNPFWNEYAQFTTNKGHTARIDICWEGPLVNGHPTRWQGSKMHLYHSNNPRGALIKPTIIRLGEQIGSDATGYQHAANTREEYKQVDWYRQDGFLPPELQHRSGHANSHPFIVHEFVSSLVEERKPAVDVYEAIAYTVPGIVAHQSALQGGQRLTIPQFDPA